MHQHTEPRAGCPGKQARDGMVAYQKAGRVRTYTVEPKEFDAQ